MFEEYLKDSHELFLLGKQASKEKKDMEAKRYFRASTFYALASMEAFINYTSQSFIMGNAMTDMEIAFLDDKHLYYSVDKGKIVEKREFHSTEDKIKLLIRKFVLGFDFNIPLWSRFTQFKNFRDSLVHPKSIEDEIEISTYKSKIKKGLSSVIELMNTLSIGMYKKPMRKKILDLIPD
ncbi:MAG: hypothetical protein NT096_14620 [Proteobacteria bacterium]|nr:hypothetical protein [Pseudomonadota bacterium]